LGHGWVFVSLTIIVTLFYTGQTFGIWIIIIMLWVYMACLAFSINAEIWVLIGEIFPTSIRMSVKLGCPPGFIPSPVCVYWQRCSFMNICQRLKGRVLRKSRSVGKTMG
tara:strand:- start:185003 stop:185329 length:327 start_codon:yes stop_codon:yes gene_type:complete